MNTSEISWEDESLDDPDVKVFLTTLPLEVSAGIEFVKSEKAGAVISFGGTTRDNFEGKEVKLLAYEAHIQLALRSMAKIAKLAKSKFSCSEKDEYIHKIFIAHRLGQVPVKEESIVICLSSTHRQEGWQAGIWLMDTFKEKVEIWKLENYKDGTTSWKENENSNITRIQR